VPYIEVKRLKVIFRKSNEVVALDDFNLHIKEHEFFSIIGPSGCGKTTFLRVLAGLTSPTSGDVLIDGKRVFGPGRDRAMVFQEHVLMPWRTALRNVAFGLETAGVPSKLRKERAMELIQLVGLEGFENTHPHQLSGGMRQRVGLARALAVNPSILLMDEPFGSVDAQTREQMQDELLRIWEQEKKTVIFVTHSIEEAIYLSDRIAIMTCRPGHIKEVINVNLPRPREYLQRMSRESLNLRLQIWEKIASTRICDSNGSMGH
jgi:NitT/TauT family transport system ATP-binding protein